VLGLLTVLAAGAVVLGLSEAPATADLLVHNGAVATVGASSLTAVYQDGTTGRYVRVEYRSPDQTTEYLLKDGPNSAPVQTQHVPASEAKSVLNPFSQLELVTGFKAQGPDFVAVSSATPFLPPAERQAVKGTIRFVASVATGFLVHVVESYHLTIRTTTPTGTRTSPRTGTDDFKVTAIGGEPAPGR
jgi:hypothetical protein